MIHAEYFRKHFEDQLDAMGSGSTTAVLRLRTGEEMAIQKIVAIEDAYLIVKVYPYDLSAANQKGRKAARDARRKVPGGEVFYDQIALGYGDIMLVRLTIVDPDEKNPMGFGIDE